jgi:hypothetical protein
VSRFSVVVPWLGLALGLALGCDTVKIPRMPWDRPSIAEAAGPSPMLPLALPKKTLRGEKGDAPLDYPAGFAATIKPDGIVLFPQGGIGKVIGPRIFVSGDPVVALNDAGEVSGSGLKRKYKFTPDGDLLDADGHGIRLLPEGGIRGIGGKYQYKEVMTWKNDGAAAGDWDKSAWRTVALVSLVMIENLVPTAIR